MKKMIKALRPAGEKLGAACLMALALTMASCGDDDVTPDNPDKPGNTTPVLEITQQNWPFTQWGDPNVKPGNDFFSYSIGRWYEKADVGRGTSFEARQTINQYYNTYYFHYNDLPSLQALLADTAHVDDVKVQQQAKAYTQSWVERVENTATYAEVGTVIGEMFKAGYETVVMPYVYNSAGTGTMAMAVVSRSLLEGDDNETDDLHHRDFRNSRRFDTRFTRLYHEQVTRASDEFYDLFMALGAAIGLMPGENMFYFSDDEALVEILSQPLDDLKDVLIASIKEFDAPFTSRSGIEATGHNYLYAISLLYDEYMNYEVAKYLYDKGFYDKDKQKRLSALCSEIRNTLGDRISQLPWMSSATKSAAKGKLQKMQFFVGYPTTWYTPGLPDLSGNNMVEDVHQLLAADFNLTKHVCGKSPRDAANYMCPQMMNIAADNAFYSPNYNTFFIFPCYMFEPYYREDVLDAWLYAAAGLVIGHEMVHGFDTTGAMYDSNGNYSVSDDSPYGWWAEADMNEYTRRQQLLIDSYNKIPFEPWIAPGVYSDGKKCLGENIADCGGLEVALDCYTRHIEGLGYKQDDVEQLQRLFMQAWAYMWRTKYNKAIIDYLVENDVHSSYYARVIGPMQNCDLWYTLFDVQPTEKYYLSTTQRCHMW